MDDKFKQVDKASVTAAGKLLLVSGVIFHIVNFISYAPTLIGMAYILGFGVPRDLSAAEKWFRLSARWGHAAAQTNLASLYAAGQGVPQDYGEAAKWLKMAAERGDTRAQSGLGTFYMQGKGVASDFVEAAKWLRLAARKGDAEAQTSLGLLYVHGKGVSQDLEEALKWLRMAATTGHGEAQAMLGNIYMHGIGTPVNYAEAFKWLEKPTVERRLPCKNCLAWLLATCPDETIRDGNRALILAKEVAAEDATPENLDTLAAAYAAVENFEEAARVQEEVIMRRKKGGDASDSDIDEYRQRLQGYKEKKAWRHP